MIPDKKERMAPKTPTMEFVTDLIAGGIAGAIAKTAVAPIERVKIILQTQDLNPRIRRGEIPPYKGDDSKTAHALAPPVADHVHDVHAWGRGPSCSLAVTAQILFPRNCSHSVCQQNFLWVHYRSLDRLRYQEYMQLEESVPMESSLRSATDACY